MPWSFYIPIRGRAASWVVSIVFIIIGILITFFAPAIIEPSRDRETGILALRVLGGVFLALGGFTLVWMLIDLYLIAARPALRDAWYWWGNFLAGLIGAGLFAIPATLCFPLILIAYLLRPNALFPLDSPNDYENLIVGLLFSVAGILSLLMMFFVGRANYRGRPRWPHRKRARAG